MLSLKGLVNDTKGLFAEGTSISLKGISPMFEIGGKGVLKVDNNVDLYDLAQELHILEGIGKISIINSNRMNVNYKNGVRALLILK